MLSSLIYNNRPYAYWIKAAPSSELIWFDFYGWSTPGIGKNLILRIWFPGISNLPVSQRTWCSHYWIPIRHPPYHLFWCSLHVPRPSRSLCCNTRKIVFSSSNSLISWFVRLLHLSLSDLNSPYLFLNLLNLFRPYGITFFFFSITYFATKALTKLLLHIS